MLATPESWNIPNIHNIPPGPPLVVAVALANKTARIAWAVSPGLWRLSRPRRQGWSLRENNDALRRCRTQGVS
jgi:hypothetical protein